ncbi:uncharacterized protein N7477_001976 [Penicillium maclennaniae]|uniref:uncharacterized protein n=1 Tax=Penicillium maclennaniae TaxID=1343394 RepID=UPI002541DA9C|nr:uncharacterized protein N7477_001976 [Penicillium maclennaniae]KAJ5682036.1 hypothetical protein N7477_001976 [Penicillium maclennaniae]
MSLAKQQKPGDSVADFSAAPPANSVGYDTPPSLPADDGESKTSPRDPGTLVVNGEGTNYIDSANWRAILEEINGVKEYIEDHAEDSDDDGLEEDPYSDNSPALLLGIGRSLSKEELIVDIPPRSTVDRLVSRFFKTSEPSIVAIHVPTFQREYEQFWANPQGMSYTWIALLYSIMALSVSLYHRNDEPSPLHTIDSMTAWNIFRRRAAQCLTQANYLKPGQHKVEALFMYSLSEFYRNQDAQMGVSYLFGITIRLAMRMGYHRDPSHFPDLSAKDGEMRRRSWALLTQLDTLISFQVGLPRTIQPWLSDTRLPSNLFDTDFDENTAVLPQSRPDEERTPSSYTCAKARIQYVFGQISDLAYSREPVSYDEILEIERRLDESHNMLPSFFRLRPIGQCIADPSELVMRRYTLEMLYQKARIVLHRPYIGERQKHDHSRSICLTAAKEILRHHADIWNESLPGGQLHAERFLLNSFQNTDFMLSSMILCLELSHDNERGHNAHLSRQERNDILALLETTRKIFEETRRRSVDTQRAFAALSLMLGRVKGNPPNLSSRSESQGILMEDHSPFQLFTIPIEQQQYLDYTSNGEIPVALSNTDDALHYPSLDVIEEMLNAPAHLDWRLYDSRVSGLEETNQDTFWFSATPPVPLEGGFTYPPSGNL